MTGVLRRVGLVLGLPMLLLVSWYVLSADSTNFYLPSLRSILTAFGATWTPAELRADVLPSVLRLLAGYGLAVVIGVGLGVVIGGHARIRAAVEPVMEFFRAIPPPVLVPVIMLFAGIGDAMKVIVIVTGAVWPILLNTVEGVRAVDSVLADTARIYRITGGARLRHLVLRGASPQIVIGMRQALAIAVVLMVISEMFAPINGLGFSIVQFQRTFAIPEMWSGIIVLGLLGFALSVLFTIAERRILGWYHGLRRTQRRP